METENLIDVLLDMKKKLHLTYQQLADIWQVNLSTAKSKLRGGFKSNYSRHGYAD